jgi:toluene monooxygenase system protein D
MTTATKSKLVGPVIRGVDEDIINAVIDAAEQDNPDKEIDIDDRGGYVRVQADHSMVLTRSSLEAALGLVSFAGRLTTEDEKWEWALHG